MKLFTIIPFMLFFSGLAFAQSASDMVGDWAWSGNGCRDSDLSLESHVSAGAEAAVVTSAVLTFNADNTASLRAVLIEQAEVEGGDGESRIMNETGTWRLDGNRIIISDAGEKDPEDVFPLKLIGSELVGPDDDATADGLCSGAKVFVRVFSKVSS